MNNPTLFKKALALCLGMVLLIFLVLPVRASNAAPLEGCFDSMALFPNGKVYLTKGSQYFRWSNSGAQFDRGYPRPIKGNWGKLPSGFAEGFDAMAVYNGKIYVTKGDRYIRYSDRNGSTVDAGYPLPIKGNWGDLPPEFEHGFDSMATLGNGKLYITKGAEYVRYSDSNATAIDPGYPAAIEGNWGTLPPAFNQGGFDAMTNFPNGKTYITHCDRYVRYSDSNATTVDPGYPAPIPGNWGNLPD